MASKTLLCVVYDKVAKEHGPIFEAKSDAIAKRMFGNLMKDTPNPDDFALVVCGVLSRQTPDADIEDIEVYPEGRVLC